ncbi:MAG TPA: response regulator [Ideonella sp.]|uniref:hybrid sensor histidine kinase/response regulator n=1 Tax=Ideonella sp. TaxID=1929293 RepID=UPI002C027AC5|nr:response regulator [Ideonella sp.]HSI47678.1 response regulator [Ideonella sp.]
MHTRARVLKHFARLMLPFGALTCVLAGAALWRGLDYEEDRALFAEQSAALRGATALTESLAPVFRHVRSLTQEAPVRRTLAHPDDTQPMVEAFRSLLQRNASYQQVRWLDTSGRERVRMQLVDGQPQRVEGAAELQDKSERYFVREARVMRPGAIYLSQVDAYQEHGKVLLPLQLVLRVCIGVADDAGKPLGLLIINLDANAIFATLDRSSTIGNRQLLLLDDQGRWQREFRDQTPSGAASAPRTADFSNQHRALWSRVQAEREGTAIDDGLWGWRSMDPMAMDQAPQQSHNMRWVVLTYRPMVELQATRLRLTLGVLGFATLTLAMLAFLCWRLARERSLLVQARQAAESAARTKAAFLANMSHEIRTPLHAVVGMTLLLKRSPCTPQQAERLERIHSAAGHLLALLNNILDASKLEAGGQQLEAVDFSLPALLDSVISLVTPAAEAKGLSLSVDHRDCPDWLRGDPLRLRQALLNYANNAVKFTERGGISLNARCQPLAADPQRLELLLEVEDTGPGVEPKVLDRLFGEFEQADETVVRRFGGTGLGLAITRKLARWMGGEAGATSEPGRGSVFWLRVPMQRGEPVTTATLSSGDNHGADLLLRQRHPGARVLLAEDNPVNREIACEFLAHAGLQVTAVDDGAKALDLALAKDFDLLLLDMQMPELDGLEVARRLRAGRADPPHVPILALTANAFDSDRQACLAAGMDDFITKPVNPEHLYLMLLRWLDHGRQEREHYAQVTD